MKATLNTKLRLNYSMTAGQLVRALRSVPETARVSVYTYNADSRDPRETSYTELTFTWEEER